MPTAKNAAQKPHQSRFLRYRVHTHAMKPGFSLYLDCWRILAATLVFFDHACAHAMSGGFLWRLAGYGQDGVLLFFVLSGFIIGYVVDTRETDWRSYAAARCGRIYSVVIPALCMTTLLIYAGATVQPVPAHTLTGYITGIDAASTLRILTFTNETWQTTTPEGFDQPIWSLGFEVPYYLIFGIAVFTRGAWKIILPLMALAAFGPRVALMFPVWLLGLACWKASHVWRATTRSRATRWLAVATLLLTPLLYAAAVRALPYHLFICERSSLSPARLTDYLSFYARALIFGANLVAAAQCADLYGALLSRAKRPITLLASGTFALYLFHLPIMRFFAAVLPMPNTAWSFRIFIFIVTPVLAFSLAMITEWHKSAWRAMFARLLDRTRPRRAVPAP
jgi:peptidoglycan/LPS O-acetylase OafA/YrhL